MKKNIYFSHKTHPTLSIIDAIYMSISVPLAFEPMIFNDFRYIDGGYTEDSPCMLYIDKEDVAILRLKYTPQNTCKTLIEYFIQLMDIIFLNRTIYSYKTYHINFKEYSCSNYKMSDSDKMKLFTNGYNNISI
jgi:predicted acylesterase/phospholipase RssA